MHWVIGDIHGMLRPLQRLIDLVMVDDPAAQLIFAGDYVNRGPDSQEVIEHLLTLRNARFVRGNHDDMLDLILSGQCFADAVAGTDPADVFRWFMNFGLGATLISYGADPAWLSAAVRDPTAERMKRLVDFFPPAHRQFIRNLLPAVDGESFFVVHGRWPAMQTSDPPPIAEQLEQRKELRHAALWGRYPIEEINAEKNWTRRAFVGHTPVHTYFSEPRYEDLVPLVGPNLVLIDTAAALAEWGRLTAFCVEENRFLQVTQTGQMVLA